MKTIGILGTGRMGVRLARMFSQAGVQVRLGSRNPERSRRIVAELGFQNVIPSTYDEALAAPVVLPAIFIRDGLLDQVGQWKNALTGKIVVDITNPFNHDYSDFVLPWDTSGAEEIQRLLPDSRVVGAFKNVWWEVFDQPDFDGLKSDVFVVGNDPTTKRSFLELVDGTPFRYVDAGPLANARTVERMTLMACRIGMDLGYFPRMNYRILGEAWTPGQAAGRVAELIRAAG